jgi:hypothetical protein
MVSEKFLKMTFCTVKEGSRGQLKVARTLVVGIKRRLDLSLNSVVKFKGWPQAY